MNRQNGNILGIVNIVLKRWWLLLAIVCIVGVGSFVVSEYFITPRYESTGKLLVSTQLDQDESNLNIGSINTSTRLVSTYIQIFKTNTFLKRIAHSSGLTYTAEDIEKMLNLSSLDETEVLQVKITCTSPTDAKILTERILDSAQDEIDRIGQGGYVSIIDEASTPIKPAYPNVNLNVFIGILLGVFIGVLFIFIVEMLDTRINREEDLTEKYELPVLGIIPNMDETSNRTGRDKSGK